MRKGRPELQYNGVLTLLIKDAADDGQLDTVIIGEGEQLKGQQSTGNPFTMEHMRMFYVVFRAYLQKFTTLTSKVETDYTSLQGILVKFLLGNRKKKALKTALWRREKGHLRVKSIFCSCKGSGFWSKHSHVSKSSVTAVPGELMPLLTTSQAAGI